MNIRIITPPTEEPITLDEAKQHCRVSDDSDDSYITALITAAREYVETQTRRAIITQTLELRLPGWMGGRIELPRPPLVSVSSVVYTLDGGTTATLNASLYTVMKTEPGAIVPTYNTTWPTTRAQVESVFVTYVAGYGGPAAVPQTIKHAMLLLIGHWYENREASTVGVEARALPMAVQSLIGNASWGDYK